MKAHLESAVLSLVADSEPVDVLVHARDTKATLIANPDEAIVSPPGSPRVLHEPDIIFDPFLLATFVIAINETLETIALNWRGVRAS